MGSWARWPAGNAYDNAKAKSFMKTLKGEAIYLMDYETFEDVTAFTTPAGPLRASPAQFEDHHTRQTVKTAA